MAVRAAASLCVWLARKDGCSVLLPGDRRPIEIGHDMGAWPAVHARLALVEEGAAPAGGVLGPRGGAVIWVTGADLRTAPRALERLPAGSRYVVAPGTLPVRAARVRGGRLHRLPGGASPPGGGGMSAILGRTPATAPAGAPAPLDPAGPTRSVAAVAVESLGLRLLAFSALAAFATSQWGMLVENPPGGRELLVVLVATGGGALLGLLGRAPLPRPAVHALAALVGVAMVALGLMAAGLPGRFLLPAHWAEFVGRPRSRSRRRRGCGVALRRPGGVAPAQRPARRAGAPHDRRAAQLLAGKARRGDPARRRPGHAAPPVRHRRRGARPGRAGAARVRAADPRRRLAVAAADAAARGRDRRGRRGQRRAPVAARRRRARRRPAMVGLPRLELVRGRQGPHLRLEPQLRPAQLVAGGRDRAEREVEQAPLLEGRDARRLRRPPLVPDGRVRRDTARPAGRVRQLGAQGPLGLQRVQPRAGTSASASRSARCRRRSSSAPAWCSTWTACRPGWRGTARRGSWEPTGSRRGTPTRCARMCRTRPRRRCGNVPSGYSDGTDPLHRRSSCRSPASPRHASRPGRRWSTASRRHASARNVFVPLRGDPASGGGPGAAEELRDSPYARMYQQALELTHDAADGLRRGEERRELAPGELHLLGARTHAPLSADGLPVGRRARLLPAVLGGDGADAPHGGHPRPRGGRLLDGLVQQGHEGIPRSRPRRALLGRGLVHRDRLGAVRPDSRALACSGPVKPAGGERRRAARR